MIFNAIFHALLLLWLVGEWVTLLTIMYALVDGWLSSRYCEWWSIGSKQRLGKLVSEFPNGDPVEIQIN